MTLREMLSDYWYAFQQELFPRLESELGPMGERYELFVAVLELVRVEALLPYFRGQVGRPEEDRAALVPSIYSIVPPNDGSALRHGHHFEPVDFVIDHGRGHHDAYSAGSCQRTYARACGCRQRPRCHREELIESERGWSGREAFVTMMQTADLGQGNDRSRPGRLNGSSIRCVLAERQVGP